MMNYAGDKLTHVHIADCFNHRANVGNRYIINPPGVDARIHQHNEIGNGDVDWDEFFGTLRDVKFDGIATVCVFGWEETADDIHRRMLERVRARNSVRVPDAGQQDRDGYGRQAADRARSAAPAPPSR